MLPPAICRRLLDIGNTTQITQSGYETTDYNVTDGIPQPDDETKAQKCSHNIFHRYTDNQAAEHITTQPNMNDDFRSIDIRIHGIRQDYLDEAMRIGGVASEDNTTDILTKNLQPHLHQIHCQHINLTPH
jgi:hypothetical protein